MSEVWKSLLPILLADILNPVLFAFMVYAAGSRRAVLNSSMMLLGHTTAYFVVGIALGFGLEAVIQRLQNPRAIDFWVEAVVGVVLLVIALRSRNATARQPQGDSEGISPLKAFGVGVVINFVGIPFAVPYFAALAQMLKLDLPVAETISVLLVYNLLYALPFLIVPVMAAVGGASSTRVLGSIKDKLDRLSAFLMPIILALLALTLIADAITYFLTGESLF